MPARKQSKKAAAETKKRKADAVSEPKSTKQAKTKKDANATSKGWFVPGTLGLALLCSLFAMLNASS